VPTEGRHCGAATLGAQRHTGAIALGAQRRAAPRRVAQATRLDALAARARLAFGLALRLTALALCVRKTSEGETGVGSTYDLTTVFKGSESQMTCALAMQRFARLASLDG
jgi:hypothetical protein